MTSYVEQFLNFIKSFTIDSYEVNNQNAYRIVELNTPPEAIG
jgi:hypothetical protein